MEKNKFLKDSISLLWPIVVSLALYFFCSGPIPDAQAKLLAVLFLLVALWTNEALPLGVVSLLPIIIFPSFDILNVNATTANYSKSILFLFLGGFFLGLAVEKTNLHQAILDRLFRVLPYRVIPVTFCLAGSAAVLSALLSNTTTTLLMMPLALHLSSKRDLKQRFVLAVAYGATIGGIMTPVGTPPNLIFLGVIKEKGMESIPFLHWMLLCIPLAVCMLVILALYLSWSKRKENIEDLSPEVEDMTGDQYKLIVLLAALALVLALNSPIPGVYEGLGLNEKLLLLGAGLMVFLPGLKFLNWEDTRKTPYEILFLFGAGFSIARAVSHTGLDDTIATQLLNFGQLPAFLLISLIALLVTFSTEITSNMALTTVAIPIIYSLCQKTGLNAHLYMMVATICASYAFMLPIATAPNAIAMSSNSISVKEMAKYGFWLNLIAVCLTSLCAYFVWRLYFA